MLYLSLFSIILTLLDTNSTHLLLCVEFLSHLPGEFTEEKDEEDVAGGDGDAGDQRHPGQTSFNVNTHQTCLGFDKISKGMNWISFTLSFQIVSALIRSQWVEW